MSICFLFAATATHVRVYMFRQRPGGHCLCVGRMGICLLDIFDPAEQ